MRNYYYCEANMIVYTETEKLNSVLPGCRFELIGSYRSRKGAEAAYADKYGFYPINGKRR